MSPKTLLITKEFLEVESTEEFQKSVFIKKVYFFQHIDFLDNIHPKFQGKGIIMAMNNVGPNKKEMFYEFEKVSS